MRYNHSVFPIQKLPMSKKNEEWQQACIDYIIGMGEVVSGVLKPDFKTREEAIKYIEGTHISRNDIVKTFISDGEYWLKETH